MDRAAIIGRVRALREVTVERGATQGEQQAAERAIERIYARYALSDADVDVPRRADPVMGVGMPPRPPGWVGQWPPPMFTHYFATNTGPATTAVFGNGGITIIIG